MVVRKVSMILVGGVFGFHLKPDMQVHLALVLIALMIVAHLVTMPFDELTKDHRVLHWLEMGSLSVCWLTLHAGTVFFIGEKDGRVSHESLTALSFYVVGGNLLFTLFLLTLYFRAACKEVKKEDTFLHKRSSALATAAAAYFSGLLRRESVQPKASQKRSNDAVNPMFSKSAALEMTPNAAVLSKSAAITERPHAESKNHSITNSATEASEIHSPLPKHWEAFKDEVSGDYFYYNHETDESQWDRP